VVVAGNVKRNDSVFHYLQEDQRLKPLPGSKKVPRNCTMTVSITILSIIPLTTMAYRIKPLSMMALISMMTLSMMTLSMVIFSMMTLSMMTLSMMTLSTVTLSMMTPKTYIYYI
jgi:hypothetical protein